MEQVKKIEVRGYEVMEVDIDDLHNLQPESFKDLKEEKYVKLRNSMTERKFSFPLFVWVDEQGLKYITDGHQRIRTLRQMRQEGVEIPPLPAWRIDASTRKEAKELLLLHESRYGEATQEGFYEFMNEPGLEINPDEIGDLLSLPEFEREYEQSVDSPDDSDEGADRRVSREVECPECHHKFIM